MSGMLFMFSFCCLLFLMYGFGKKVKPRGPLFILWVCSHWGAQLPAPMIGVGNCVFNGDEESKQNNG